MTSILPRAPSLVFTILEPLSLTIAAVTILLDPSSFIDAQCPSSEPQNKLVPPSTFTIAFPTSSSSSSSYPAAPFCPSLQLALQTANLYVLFALIAIFIVSRSSDPHLVRTYLKILAVADIGHLGVIAWALGWQRVLDVSGWNGMMWANIACTTGLLIMRVRCIVSMEGCGEKMGRWKDVTKVS